MDPIRKPLFFWRISSLRGHDWPYWTECHPRHVGPSLRRVKWPWKIMGMVVPTWYKVYIGFTIIKGPLGPKGTTIIPMIFENLVSGSVVLGESAVGYHTKNRSVVHILGRLIDDWWKEPGCTQRTDNKLTKMPAQWYFVVAQVLLFESFIVNIQTKTTNCFLPSIMKNKSMLFEIMKMAGIKT